MNGDFYWLGVLLAILSGVVGNCGLLLQKKVIVGLPEDSKFMRSLIKKPLWLLGLILNFGVGSIFFLFAQIYIGPTLVPGLLDVGIIVLALGSVKIIGDKLKKKEIMAILLMIMSTFLLSFSGLSIEISETNLLEIGFIIRFSIFTITLLLLALILDIFQKKGEKFKPILLASVSGLCFSLSDFWIAPLIGVITHMFGGIFSLGEIFLFIICSIILVLTNFFGIATLQKSFKYGVASNMVTIQQVPLNITPIVMYLFIFLLIPPSVVSIVFLILGSMLIIISSYLLSKRQIELEKIK